MIFEDNFIFLLVKAVLITTCTLGMMSTLTAFKYRAKKIFLIFGVYLLWVAASTAVILHFWGFEGLVRAFLFTISAPAIFLAYLMDKSSPAQSVFNYATQIVFSLILTISALLLNTAIAGNQYTDLLIRAGIYAVVIFLEYRFLRRPFQRLTNMIQAGWGVLSLIPVFFCLLLVLVGTVPVHYIDHPISLLYIAGILVTMLVVYFVVYQSLMRQYQLQMLSHDRDMLRIQISSMNKQANAIFAAEEKLRILRHDVRHFTEIMRSEQLQGSSAQTEAILATLQAAAEDSSTQFYSDNYVINSILTFYFEQAKRAGIAVKSGFTAPPPEKVEAAAFSVMLANALENSLEACRQEPAGQRIELKSRVFHGQYLMELSNSCTREVTFDKTGLPLSHKGEEHGIGTRSILAFAKEHNATVHFLTESGQFMLQLILPLDA